MRGTLSSRWTVVLAVLALIVGPAGPAAAQETGAITGTVTNTNGTPLGGVSVIVNETGTVATTAGDGSFSFSAVPVGTYSLSFTLGANSTNSEGVAVSAGGSTTADLEVDWDASFLEFIMVFSASRREERIVDAPASISAFSEAEVATTAVTGQLAKVVEFAPGVEVNQSGIYDYNLNARGFNSSLNRRVQTLVDGREPSVPFLGSTDWSALSAMHDIQSMELVRGPSSALYGANAFNGVLNVITKSAEDSLGGRATLTAGELSTIKGDLLVGTSVGSNSHFKLSASYTEGEDFYIPRVGQVEYPGLPFEAAAGTNEYDNGNLTLRFDHSFGDNGLLSLEGNTFDANGSTVVTGIGRVQVDTLERQWFRANVSTEHFNVLAFHNARKSPNQLATSSGGRIFLDSSQDKIEIQGRQTFNDGKTRLVVGASHKEEDIDTANDAGVQTLVFAPVTEDFDALFAQIDFDVSDRVKLVLAGRLDDSSLHDSQFSPKAALVFGINDRNTLRFSYNEAFQVPNYSEFFLDAPTAIPGVGSSIDLSLAEALLCTPFGVSCGFGSPVQVRALGNKDLSLEEIQSIELGYTGILNDKAFLTIDYYRNELDNFITDLTANVAGSINPNFGPYQEPAGYPVPGLIISTLSGLLPPAAFAFLSNNVDGTPIFALASYTNAGQVDTQGVDFGLNYYASPEWQFDVSYSWFDFEIQDTGGLPLSNLVPNAPDGKGSIGITYTGPRFGASLKGRFVDAFDWAAGAFQGPVPAYETFSLTANYAASDSITVGLNVSNLFDDEHYQSFGGDLLQRRALGYIGFNW